MIQLTAAGKRYGAKLLFENLDWLVTPQARVGLVGANGTGKSTLLKVLAGLETLDYGGITVARGTSFGYLPQEGLVLNPTLSLREKGGAPDKIPTLARAAREGGAPDGGRTVFAEAMSVFAELRDIEQEIEVLTHQMAEMEPGGREFAQVADRFQRLDGEFRARDGYAIEAQVGTVLSGLGFRKEDWGRGTDEFSGGWQMRIALAKLLLQKPNLLLLDEPTNHLDLETRNWLEDYLRAYPYAYVVISHDRYFLDVTVDKIAEIWNRRVQFYSGNYEKYLAEKQQRRAQVEAAYRNQKERVDQLEAFINRFRYQATKAKQVQSRVKELERMERVEVPPEEKAVHFTFPQPQPSGRMVAEFIDVAKVYGTSGDRRPAAERGQVEVFRNVNCVIERGDRIALVGANGAGKSTFIKLLAEQERPTRGQVKLGHNVQPDYFAQDQYKEFDPQRRVLEDLWAMAPGRTQTELRSLLGCFLFSDEEVFKPIGVLSGGERNRYALARMLLRPSNFLLLDEPTNHLDLRAKDVLLEALAAFTGTVVFVSHDRYFIDKLATRVFEIGGGEVRVYPGNYEEFVWQKQREAGDRVMGSAGDRYAKDAKEAEPAVAEEDENGEGKPGVAAKRINPIKLRQMKERREEVEEQITRTEAEIGECEGALARFVSVEETQRVTELLARRRDELERLMNEWEELSLVLDVQ